MTTRERRIPIHSTPLQGKMASKSPIWACKPRTEAKLKILSHYLGAWFSILAVKQFRQVYYIDGFCGPGAYTSGEQGSPVIAARMASSTAQKYPGFKAKLIFVDEDPDAIEHLNSIKAIRKQHPSVSIDIKVGKFSDQIKSIVSELKQNPQCPTFSFIDPFGFGSSPFDKLRRLMHNDHSELMINFMCGYMNRFKEHPDASVTDKIRNMVGQDDLQAIISSSDSIDAICDAFEKNLHSVGRYILKFMMRDEGNTRDNAFFFCGRQSRGFEKIKEAMWKVDPIHGNSFSAHRVNSDNPLQERLFQDEPDTHQLSKLIAEKFGNRENVAVKEIFDWVVKETETFLKPHARTELENLYEHGFITRVLDPQPRNRKRAKKHWPERLLLTFK